MEPTIPSGQRGSATDKVSPFRPVTRPMGRVMEATIQQNFQSMLFKRAPEKALDDLKKATLAPGKAPQALAAFLSSGSATQTATRSLEASKTAYGKAEELAQLVKGLKYQRSAAATLEASAPPVPSGDFDDAQYVTILDGLLQQSDQRIRMTKKFIRMLKQV